MTTCITLDGSQALYTHTHTHTHTYVHTSCIVQQLQLLEDAFTTCTTQHTHMYMQTHYIHRWTYICTDRHRCKYINTYVHTNTHMYIRTDRHTKGTHRALLILRSASCNTGLLIIRKLPRSVPLRFSILSHYRGCIIHTLAY